MARSSGKRRGSGMKRPAGLELDDGCSTPTPTRRRLDPLDALAETMDAISQQTPSVPISNVRSSGLDNTAPSTPITPQVVHRSGSSEDVTLSAPTTSGKPTEPIGAKQVSPTTGQMDSDEVITTGRKIRKATGAAHTSPKPIDLSEIPQHVGVNQPKDVDQLTRWAWEQAAASGSNNITMLQAKFKPVSFISDLSRLVGF